MNRCALSAHTRPLVTTLSKVEIWSSFAASAAALSRLTFSCGVSPDGPGFARGTAHDLALGGGTFAVACGVVEVKRVASVADRGIVVAIRDDRVRNGRAECCTAFTCVESAWAVFLTFVWRSHENF